MNLFQFNVPKVKNLPGRIVVSGVTVESCADIPPVDSAEERERIKEALRIERARASRRRWDEKNRDRKREIARKSLEKARLKPDYLEKARMAQKKYRATNPNASVARRKWYEENKDYFVRWKADNKEKVKEYAKRYYQKSKAVHERNGAADQIGTGSEAQS